MREREVEQDIAKRELEAARERVDVVMYATLWCPVCARAREYMNAKGIRYTERDVDKNPADKEDLKRINPRGSVPTISIDGDVMIGFSEGSFAKAVNRAAQRRAARF